MDSVARSKWFEIFAADDVDEFIACPDEVLIVACAKDKVLLIEEPSPAFGEPCLIFPTGLIEVGEEPVKAAQRELREETGFDARQLRAVAVLRPWSKYLRVTTHVFLAEKLFEAPLKGDEKHKIVVRPEKRKALPQLIASGALKDARAIAALALCFPKLSLGSMR